MLRCMGGIGLWDRGGLERGHEFCSYNRVQLVSTKTRIHLFLWKPCAAPSCRCQSGGIENLYTTERNVPENEVKKFCFAIFLLRTLKSTKERHPRTQTAECYSMPPSQDTLTVPPSQSCILDDYRCCSNSQISLTSISETSTSL